MAKERLAMMEERLAISKQLHAMIKALLLTPRSDIAEPDGSRCVLRGVLSGAYDAICGVIGFDFP